MFTLKTLPELADEATIVLESEFDYGPAQFVRDSSHTDMDLIYLLYRHCWCDYFSDALYRITDWPIVSASSKIAGNIHRLNRTGEGKLVDVTGYVTLVNLQTTFDCTDLYLTEDISRNKKVAALDDLEISMVTEALLHLDYDPFIALRSVVLSRLKMCAKS
jgi:hypothetical protein